MLATQLSEVPEADRSREIEVVGGSLQYLAVTICRSITAKPTYIKKEKDIPRLPEI